MRRLLMAAACLGLIACQPSKPAAPADETAQGAGAAATPIFSHAKTDTEATLSIQEAPDAPPFALKCAKAGPTLTFTAGQAQVGLSNMAAPYALSVSGATFPATLTPGSDGAALFSVAAPLTPDLLAAVRGAGTARIIVNDGYAFAESGFDAGQAFETFAADCAALTGVAAAN
jgi:hypothetical protein